ncbi:hypothetical protein NEHOM01_2191 [Nematocida homosporus]|uniref:uncharacterized protein n=1 Tax=Nematocida homosporus TaxID=1912981 RepID=UPI00221F57DA|nr:uncharacterized protein NEHOM01_2191 [Nematocida homosporus]KAI5187455.1 hypothetical protein NEHOM01_2191 [Nematocida homosporus]
MDKKSKRTHWRHTYLKRINSIEVTMKRSRTTPNPRPATTLCSRINTLPIFKQQEEDQTTTPRTPDRIINTPKRTIYYLSPNKNIDIPPTPGNFTFEQVGTRKACKRLFW